jgi:hypothetical protein
MPRDLTFQALKLLAQYIVSNPTKIPEGQIFQKTSCMNQEEAEIIGVIEAAKVFLDKPEDQEVIKELNKVQDYFEKLGISKWFKGELTHLGFRAGTRYEEKIDVAADSVIQIVDEAAINASNAATS